MSAANRSDVLTDALYHYCTMKESKLSSIILLMLSQQVYVYLVLFYILREGMH